MFTAERRIVAVVGSQFGDEGKGKLVDLLSMNADTVCRYNGGANAGHTVVVSGVKYSLHLSPCGIIQPHVRNLIGAGVVIHLDTLMKELYSVDETVPGAFRRLFICKRTHLLFDIHKKLDAAYECQSNGPIGTTKRGIGPCYASKALRRGIRAGDLHDWEAFKASLKQLYDDGLRQFSDLDLDYDSEIQSAKCFYDKMKDQIVDGVQMLHDDINGKQKNILIEGANATMLDIDFGTYPFVTSSHTSAGGISIGLGIPPRRLDMLIGVVKSYCTRVGNGPFPTELNDEVGQHLLHKGKEYGTTTGRPRRCGWLDIPMLRYTAAINGYDCIILTKLDVLTGLKELNICTGFVDRDTGCEVKSESYGTAVIQNNTNSKIIPRYTVLEGWGDVDISNVKKVDDLPQNAQAYVKTLTDYLNVPVKWIGVGPDREQIIELHYSNL